MMSLWDALRMNMMISYQELVRTFLKVKSRTGSVTELKTKSAHRCYGYAPSIILLSEFPYFK